MIRVRDSLQADDAPVGVLAGDAGEAAAINLYGRGHGLPEVISGSNSHWLRGYGNPPPRTVIAAGFLRADLEILLGVNVGIEGFRFDADERWPYPNPTGLTSVMEGYCPPHFRDMRAAVDALCEREFGPGDPFHPDTPGPWKESRKIWPRRRFTARSSRDAWRYRRNDAALTIEGIDIRNQFLAASALPRTQELQGQLQGLEDQKKSFSATEGVLEEKRAFFRNLAAGMGKGEKETVNVDEIKKLYTYYGDELSSVAENILSVERSEAKLAPEIDRVKRELEALSSGQQKSQRAVLVSVKAGASAKAEFTLSYAIGNASWAPSYDARVDSTTGKVELLYNALIRQKTTEDWSDVRLILSTAQPGRNGRMPDLEPAFVDFKIPEAMPMAAARASTTPVPMRAEAPAQADKLSLESTNAEATVQTTGLAVAYQVELPVAIPADGQPHRTNVTLLNLQGGPEYVTTPKLDPGVFLRVHLVNTSPALLLPGPVSVFRDGEFTGTIPLSLLPVGGDFDLYVGQDDSIEVERKETVDKRSETGILNKRAVEDRTYQISMQNFRANPIKLQIYDQLPVSKNADIVVNQGQFSDKPATSDKNSGKLSWNIELGPKAKKVIEFSYWVEWPKGKEIAGGL